MFTPEQEDLLQAFIAHQEAESASRWDRYGIMAQLLDSAPKGSTQHFKRAVTEYIARSTSDPPAPRTQDQMKMAWRLIPAHLRENLSPSKGLLVIQAIGKHPDKAEHYATMAVELPFGALKERLEEELDVELRDDVAAVTVRKAMRSAVRRLPADVAGKTPQALSAEEREGVVAVVREELEGVGE